MKRVLSFILVLSMILGSIGMAFADAPSVDSLTGNLKVDELINQGLVQGYEDGTYGLDKAITRAEVATMVVRALDAEAEAEGMKGIPSKFSDMGPDVQWANGYVNYAVGKGIIEGYPEGDFKPGNDITYSEVAAMLVRVLGGLTEAEEKVAVWPNTYLTKAAELGILKDVSGITSYEDKAVREKVFEMVYNTYAFREIGQNTVIKAIVLENNRVVPALKSDNVVIEVIREVQRSRHVEETRDKFEAGDQKQFSISNLKGFDVEEMLGKVYDFTVNKNGDVIAARLDNSYEYKTKSSPNVDYSRFDGVIVNLGERYDRSDERVYRTYYNDKDYAYRTFVDDVRDVNKPSVYVDYARYTTKNGKVIFVDAYGFEDIAPVKDVRRDGLDVYVYNDERDAREEKFEPRALVVAYNAGKFSRIDRNDIATNDVVHVYNKNRMIVKQDAVVEGVYKKVERRTGNAYYVHVGDKGYKINDTSYRRPVYAHDSKAYATLRGANAQYDLAPFFNEEVLALIDLNGNLQLIGAALEYTEGMAIVEQILARGQGRFIPRNNERLELDETYNSRISAHNLRDQKTTTNQRLNNFDKNDLVFVKGDGGNIDSLVRIASEKDMRDEQKSLESTDIEDMNNSFIRMDDKTLGNNGRYQVLNRTNVFVIDSRGNARATTVATLQDLVKRDETIDVFVLTDKEVTDLLDARVITDRNRITDRDDIAHTLVFFDPAYRLIADSETVLVTNVYTARTPHYITGQRPDNRGKTKVDRTAGRNVYFDDKNKPLNTGDIVSLKLTRDDDKLVQDFEVLIPANKVNRESYRVVDIKDRVYYAPSEYRRLVLEDASGHKWDYWLVRDAEEFGFITMDSVVTFHTNRDGDIDVIRVYSANTPVTANPAPISRTGLVKKMGTEPYAISIDEKTPYFLNEKTVLKDKDGNVLRMGAKNVYEFLLDGDSVDVTIKGDEMTIQYKEAIRRDDTPVFEEGETSAQLGDVEAKIVVEGEKVTVTAANVAKDAEFEEGSIKVNEAGTFKVKVDGQDLEYKVTDKVDVAKLVKLINEKFDTDGTIGSFLDLAEEKEFVKDGKIVVETEFVNEAGEVKAVEFVFDIELEEEETGGDVVLKAEDIETEDAAFGALVGITVTFPEGVESVTVVSVDGVEFNTELNNGETKSFAVLNPIGENELVFSYVVNGETKTLSVTK